MAYSNSQAELRGDVRAVVLEGADEDQLFIGEKVFPVWQSSVRVGQYPKFKLADAQLLNNLPPSKRAPRSAYSEVTREYDTDTFDCIDRGFTEAVDDVYAADIGRFFDAESMSARMCLTNLKINHETEVVAALYNTSNFNTTTGIGAYTEANLASTMDFPKDVLDAIDRLYNKGIKANTIVLNTNLWSRVRRSTKFQNFVRGQVSFANAPIDQQAALASFSGEGITQILVGRAGANANKRGQTYSGGQIWNNTYFWVGKVAGGDPMAGGAGRTINWTEDGGPFIVESYRDEKIRSDIVRVRHNVVEKVVDGSAGELIITQYS
jgi:hypothetical protein